MNKVFKGCGKKYEEMSCGWHLAWHFCGFNNFLCPNCKNKTKGARA